MFYLLNTGLPGCSRRILGSAWGCLDEVRALYIVGHLNVFLQSTVLWLLFLLLFCCLVFCCCFETVFCNASLNGLRHARSSQHQTCGISLALAPRILESIGMHNVLLMTFSFQCSFCFLVTGSIL